MKLKNGLKPDRKIKQIIRCHPYMFLLGFVAFILVIWEVLSRQGWLDMNDWASPLQIIQAIYNDSFHSSNTYTDQNSSMTLLQHILLTLKRWLTGFGISAIIGISIGFFLGLSRTSYVLGRPVLNLLRGLPSAAIWPVCGLIFGFNIKSQIVVIVFGTTWPILLNTISGLRSLPQEIRDSLAFMKITLLQRWSILLRCAASHIVTGLEIGCSVAFLLTITVEIFFPGYGGIGWYLFFHQEYREQAQVFAGLFIAALIGLGLNTCIDQIRKLVVFEEGGAVEGQYIGRYKKISEKLLNQSKTSDSTIVEILKTDYVTEVIRANFGNNWRLKVLYNECPPYSFPKELHNVLKISTNESDILQRDITIEVCNMETYKTILFARSWIYTKNLKHSTLKAIKDGRLTIGEIIRMFESEVHYKNLWYRIVISQKLGDIFDRSGVVKVIHRVRIIEVNDKPTILIHEFVRL
ncbi:MAG: ABC transporter permease subunit [bacterium]